MPKPRLTLEEWRAKRELRRQMQRAQNIGRAKKMHRVRVAFDKDCASIPIEGKEPDPPSSLQYHIGCSGWFYWHWRGCFYPQDCPTNQWFAHYARQFDTVELNASFYSWPTFGAIQQWIKQIGHRNFKYTIKVCELITHVKRFAGTKELVKDFGFIADLLGERMGCFLFQLPPSFKFSSARLNRILKQLDPARTNVVEFRHSSWWTEEVFRAFRDSNTIFCSCSGPRLPDVLVKTASDIYVRFHGTKKWYRHDYDRDELAIWASRIKASEARQTWAYFNNDREGNALRNAMELRRQLQMGREEPA